MSPRRTGPGSLGQNFLIDPNIVAVIARLAALDAADVILEIGGGEGILTRRLVADTRFVHVIEIDRRLADGLAAILAGHGRLWLEDAVGADLGALEPAPSKLVANLPYSVAATVILKSVFETAIDDWVVMVQREVGERFAARPGSPAYGIPSVLAQLACEVRVLRPVSRSVFRPVPNVDSVLLGLTRRRCGGGDGGGGLAITDGRSPGHGLGPGGPGDQLADWGPVRALVHDAFSHRRKALARSVALARGGSAEVRAAVVEALGSLGLPADVRAEALAPEQFLALAGRLT
ncbi:16S rRNA (adenine(1518)-N(6)/adenine(1519)-N(6))-dimethyltransferase RsmA [Conexibacter sp. DBS9H8]|uniref:16S rRNA (adenine(1518)-N(6)/adenine(1519)-N(6))- dimethyltransferase RsmA n=1 Tax=Conexibacter sp. DBS9H8 TaxID=2937801 RepID=UPI00200ECF32|nr:16S rRNA (adenine(1518)-N(6)/adenine(1519)-N(6))-dimethyltransferase RsmA [Conexibacter sp. DBS9H8]